MIRDVAAAHARALARVQEKNKDVTILSFDTTEEKLESLSDELGVKALPAFKFYKARLGAGPGLAARAGGTVALAHLASFPTSCRTLQIPGQCCTLAMQDGKEVLDAVTGYKKAPLAASIKKLSEM